MDTLKERAGILLSLRTTLTAQKSENDIDNKNMTSSQVTFNYASRPPKAIDQQTTTPPTSISNAAQHTLPAPATTFTLFPKLPLELRIMIWKFSLPPRVILVNHNKLSHRTTRSNITETPPPHLSINQESRSLFLPIYRSLFPEPRQGPLRWLLTTPINACLVQIARNHLNLNLSHALSNRRLRAIIEQHMNAHPERHNPQKFTSNSLAKISRLNKGTINPAFFNPTQDTLYLRRPKSVYGAPNRFLSGLWTPSTKGFAEKIHHIALEFDCLSSPGAGWLPNDQPRIWSNVARHKNLTNLSSISFILLKDREVINISLDTKDVLKGNQWSFALDLKSTVFKKEMGDKWTGVTWDIVLPKEDGVGLWQAVKKWKPNCRHWEDDKRTVGEGKISRDSEWWEVKRARWRSHYGYVVAKVEGVEGDIWLGPSRLSRMY